MPSSLGPIMPHTARGCSPSNHRLPDQRLPGLQVPLVGSCRGEALPGVEDAVSRRPGRLCIDCLALAPPGKTRCEVHEQQRAREYNAQRPARHLFYRTPQWRALSKQVLREQPWCACGATTTQADHIKSVRERPELALERSNVVGMCLPCHSRKTAREDGRWGDREQG